MSNLPELTKILIVGGSILPPFLVAIAEWQWFKKLSVQQLGYTTFLASIISLAFSIALALWAVPESAPDFSFFSIFYVDALSVYFILLINLVAMFASFYTIRFLEFDSRQNKPEAIETTANWFHQFVKKFDKFFRTPRGFHILFNFFHTSMLLVSVMDNLVLLWIFIEITTVVSAPLVGYRRERKAAEAALKYVLISSAGVLFALLGTIFLVSALPDLSGNINWSVLKESLSSGQAGQVKPGLIELSFVLVMLGYGVKAGFFPMHTWLPDGHGQAPSPVSALLSGVLLKSALYAILRFYVITNLALMPQNADAPNPFASNILLISGLLSLVMAVPLILKQNRFKRVLAYHSLEHMGIIAFGFGLGGMLALFGALFHTFNHALTKALMFLAYGNIQITYEEAGIEEEKISGVFQRMPITGYILALGGLALVGAPPFNIFLSEFMILWAAIQTTGGNPLRITAIILFLISITLIFAGLVIHLGRIVLGSSPSEAIKEDKRQPVLLGILLLLILYLGFTTNPLTNLLKQSAAILCQGGICQ